MDPRPPDTYGLGYIGYHCKGGSRHELCPGYFADAFRPGEGTRCACTCHGDDDDDERGSGGWPPADPPMLFPTSDPRRFAR